VSAHFEEADQFAKPARGSAGDFGWQKFGDEDTFLRRAPSTEAQDDDVSIMERIDGRPLNAGPGVGNAPDANGDGFYRTTALQGSDMDVMQQWRAKMGLPPLAQRAVPPTSAPAAPVPSPSGDPRMSVSSDSSYTDSNTESLQTEDDLNGRTPIAMNAGVAAAAPRRGGGRGYFASFGERRSKVGFLKALFGMGGKRTPAVPAQRPQRGQIAERPGDRANLRAFAQMSQPRGLMARAFGPKPRHAWMAPENWHAAPYKDAVGRARVGPEMQPAGKAEQPFQSTVLDGISVARRPKFDFGDEVPPAVEAVFGKPNPAADDGGTGYGGAHMKALFPEIGIHQFKEEPKARASLEDDVQLDNDDVVDQLGPGMIPGEDDDEGNDVPFSSKDLL
jgi:hypothetical protein